MQQNPCMSIGRRLLTAVATATATAVSGVVAVLAADAAANVASRGTTTGWHSRTTFLLALVAAAVGLGNLWRFSYLLGEHGAPFLLVYILCLLSLAVPVSIAEILLGRRGQASPVAALRYAVEHEQLHRNWRWLGRLVGLTALLVLVCYSVVAGWGLAYMQKMLAGAFTDASAVEVGEQFKGLLASPLAQFGWQSLFITLTFGISALGIYRGLGVLFWLTGPLLFVILWVLINYGLRFGDMAAAGEFLFSVNGHDFSGEVVLIAMGQAFFTLGIGLGVGIAFGNYVPARLPIGRTVLAVAIIDSMVALAAGVAIFAIVFAARLEPAMGPGLMFVGLPYAFGGMEQGELFGALFFALVSVVALGSGVALAEPLVGNLADWLRWRRPQAALLGAALSSVLALACVRSFNDRPAAVSLFELLDTVAVTVLIPALALAVTVLVAYVLPREGLRCGLERESPRFFALWYGCLRYVAPPAILVVALATLIGPG